MKRLPSLIVILSLLFPTAGEALSPPAVIFHDVPYNSWYSADLLDANASGIVSGYADALGRPTGYFGPENPVTVAEALKIVLLGAGYDTSAGVGYGHWAAKYMSVAIGHGFQITRIPNLNLDRPATRAEVASMIADAFDVTPVAVEDGFADVTADTPYGDSVQALSEANIVTGDTDTTGLPTGYFRPLSSIKRSEMVVMIVRARRTFGHSSSSVTSSSRSSTGACKVTDCGPAPQMPNWECPNGSIGGPSCEKLPDGRCGWIIRQCSTSSSSRSSSRSSSSSSRAAQTYILTYTENGFQPSFIAIRVGDTIKFRNDSDRKMWVASNPHPTHSDYPEFDENQSVGKGAQFTFKFTKAGTWGFHNHEFSSHQGVVSVEP